MSQYSKPLKGFELDHEQGRCRIGLLALTNDYVVERDMMSMRPDDDEVHLFVARVPFEGDCEPEALAAMAGRLADVADSILPGGRLDTVIYSCTSGTATIGYENVAKAIHTSRPDVFVVTPITAAHAAFAMLDMKRISILTPYSDAVTTTTVDALKAGGVDVARVVNMGIEISDNISAVTPGSIYAAALEADDPTADGLFISCTDFRAAQMIAKIEEATGKPVVTANQATFWQAARQAGYTKSMSGYGRLLTR